MRYEEIVKQSKKHSGMIFSMQTFRYSIGQGEKLMNRLIKDGVMKISGRYSDGSLKYEII